MVPGAGAPKGLAQLLYVRSGAVRSKHRVRRSRRDPNRYRYWGRVYSSIFPYHSRRGRIAWLMRRVRCHSALPNEIDPGHLLVRGDTISGR